MRSFRARNQKLSASSRASSSKYSTRKPALSVARLGANARKPSMSGGRFPQSAQTQASSHRAEPHAGQTFTGPRPASRWNVIWADANEKPSRAYRLMIGRLWPEIVVSTDVAPSARWRRSSRLPDARADALALRLGRDRGEVPVHARVGATLDDEEPDELDRRAPP